MHSLQLEMWGSNPRPTTSVVQWGNSFKWEFRGPEASCLIIATGREPPAEVAREQAPFMNGGLRQAASFRGRLRGES